MLNENIGSQIFEDLGHCHNLTSAYSKGYTLVTAVGIKKIATSQAANPSLECYEALVGGFRAISALSTPLVDMGLSENSLRD